MESADRAIAFFERVATRERIRTYPLLMGGVFLLIAVANFAGGKGLLDAAGNVVGADFLAFYTGARLLDEGRLAVAYEAGPDFSFPAQYAVQREILAPQRPPGVHPFVNPPHAALLYWPFSQLDYGAGVAAWWACGLLALGLAVRRLRDELEGLQRWSSARLFGACFLFVPTMAWVGYGQVTAFTLWIYTESFVSLRRGREVWAGICLGCLAYKPQLAIGPAVALLVSGRWGAVVSGALCGILWLGIGVAIDPAAAAAYLDLSARLPEMIRAEGYDAYGLHSLVGFAALLLDPTSPRLAEALAWVLSLGALGWLAMAWHRTPWRPGTEGWDLRMAGTVALGLVVSPHLYLYDLMLLLLPVGVLVAHRSGRPDRPPLGGGLVLAWTVALWALCSLGTQLSLVQVFSARALGIGPRAFQLSALVIAVWSSVLIREGAKKDRPTRM
jgi:hypothetical protein